MDGLYDCNPETDRDARFIDTVDEITKDIELMVAGDGRSGRSKGGMKSKINAARIAMGSGCNAVIANGRTRDYPAHRARGERGHAVLRGCAVQTGSADTLCRQGKITVDAGRRGPQGRGEPAALRHHRSGREIQGRGRGAPGAFAKGG